MAKQYPLVQLTWLDIMEHDGDTWATIKGLKVKHPPATAVGYLIADTDEYVVLAQSVLDGSAFGRWIYPKGCILNIAPLEGK